MTKVHFMGIGGSGASAVARIAKAYGYEVTGCDMEESSTTYRLRNEGIAVTLGHDHTHVKNVDILAHTPAVFYQNENHPEYLTAAKNKIALTWEEFMARHLMKDKYVVAVSGTHGKGTTDSMLCYILEQAGLDPTCEVGANLLDWERVNYRIGKSKYFICEADEFRDKFLMYRPNLLVITSIEMDHPEYFKDLDQIFGSFVKLVKQLKTPKILIINGEDDGCKRLVKIIKTIKAVKVKIIKCKKLEKGKVKLKLPGDHIRSDAAAAWATAKVLGVKDIVIKEALEKYSGLERRFEYRGEANKVKVYDDYAHHPTAVTVNLKAVRELKPTGKVWAVFQPHMYARLEKLFNEFAQSLREADRAIVTDVYTRREQGVSTPTGKELARAVGEKATYVGGELQNVANFIIRNAEPGDVVLIMGAGDVYKVGDMLLNAN